MRCFEAQALLRGEGLYEICCRPLAPIYRSADATDDVRSRWSRPAIITGAAFVGTAAAAVPAPATIFAAPDPPGFRELCRESFMYTPLRNGHEREHFPERLQPPLLVFLVVVEVDLYDGVNQRAGRNSKKEFMVNFSPPRLLVLQLAIERGP